MKTGYALSIMQIADEFMADWFSIAGAADLAGTLDVDLVAGYTPPTGAAVWTLFEFADRDGSTFTTVDLPAGYSAGYGNTTMNILYSP